MKPQCSHPLCYEPADCSHGLCAQHCGRHRLRGYHTSKSYPKSRNPCLGVEFEVEFADYPSLQRALPLGAERDGSLSDLGCELQICGAWPRISARSMALASELRDRGAFASHRCGLHVHIDKRYASRDSIQRLFAFCKETESAWFGLVPPRRRGSTYVAALYRGIDRYEWWNLRENTIEIRLHPGTTNPYKVRGWLAVMGGLLTRLHDRSYVFPTVSEQSKESAILSVFSSDAIHDAKEARRYLQARWNGQGVLRSERTQRYADTSEVA